MNHSLIIGLEGLEILKNHLVFIIDKATPSGQEVRNRPGEVIRVKKYNLK